MQALQAARNTLGWEVEQQIHSCLDSLTGLQQRPRAQLCTSKWATLQVRQTSHSSPAAAAAAVQGGHYRPVLHDPPSGLCQATSHKAQTCCRVGGGPCPCDPCLPCQEIVRLPASSRHSSNAVHQWG